MAEPDRILSAKCEWAYVAGLEGLIGRPARSPG
jgi:hypothetical protein